MNRIRTLIASAALVAALAVPAALAPAAPAQAFPSVVIPTCAQIWSTPTVPFAPLFPAGMRLTSDTVTTGASNARQAEIINGGAHRNCTWTDSKGKRSITVSVAWIDITEQREIRDWYFRNGIRMFSLGGGPADFANVPHTAPRREMHFTSTMFFIAIDDRGFGSLGASMQSVYDTVYTLNPWMTITR